MYFLKWLRHYTLQVQAEKETEKRKGSEASRCIEEIDLT